MILEGEVKNEVKASNIGIRMIEATVVLTKIKGTEFDSSGVINQVDRHGGGNF